MNIECSSVVSRVVVHARGALVTREVLLPQDLRGGVVDIDVTGVTLQAQAGSARAALEESERVVAAVHSEIVIPKGDVRPGATLARVRDLGSKLTRISDEIRVLSERRKRLVDLAIEPYIRTHDRPKRERDALDKRFTDALEMANLVNEKTTLLDDRMISLEKEHRALSRALEAAKLEDLQTSTRDRMGDSHPRRTITTRLVGEGRPGKLLVTYAIAAARWWPTYTLRVDGKGDIASWTFEAIVAQKSGEDWSAVQLALSSADLIFDARLPELHSLRFGRAQPPKRQPFRPPPIGVDEMFSAYLAFGGGAFSPTTPLPHSNRKMPAAMPASTTTTMMAALAKSGEAEAEEDEGAGQDEDTIVNNYQAMDKTRARTRNMNVPHDAPEMARQLAPARAPAPMGAPQSMAAPMGMAFEQQGMVPAAKGRGGGFFGAVGAVGRRSETRASGGGASEDGYEDGMLSEDEPQEIEPSNMWAQHDLLVLADADSPRRGRLVPQSRADGGGGGEGGPSTMFAIREVDAAADARFRDPLESRGMFDHRYEADGRADIPSDGRVHRMTVSQSPCSVRVAWRTVPSETEEVFREAHVTNPFNTGLLGGPVDVYLEGSLLASTMIDRIDRGGTLFCGMGVDDRVKVARNVRASEESAGLLGGSIAVTHVVEIELSSTIKEPIKVTVLERVPISDEKALEVKMVKATPLPDSYDQADRGAPIRGGCRFDVNVNPGKKTPIEVVYRLVFAQKLDIVGGSRRG